MNSRCRLPAGLRPGDGSADNRSVSNPQPPAPPVGRPPLPSGHRQRRQMMPSRINTGKKESEEWHEGSSWNGGMDWSMWGCGVLILVAECDAAGHFDAMLCSSSSSSSRNEYYLGGIIALLLQEHRTMSTKSVCSSQYMVTDQHWAMGAQIKHSTLSDHIREWRPEQVKVKAVIINTGYHTQSCLFQLAVDGIVVSSGFPAGLFIIPKMVPHQWTLNTLRNCRNALIIT